MPSVRLLGQCADCLQYFDSQWRESGDEREYLIPGHECWIGRYHHRVEARWQQWGLSVEELVAQLMLFPLPPSADDPFDAEPF